VHIKTYFIYYLILTPALVNALPTDSTLTDKTIVEDSNKVRYSDNETFWGFSLGYFPILEEHFESGGISMALYTENTISKIFKLGWSYQLNIAIDGGGYMAFYGYLSYPLMLGNNNLYIKGGLGLATLPQLHILKLNICYGNLKNLQSHFLFQRLFPEFKRYFYPR